LAGVVIGKDLDEERQKIQIGFCFGQAEGMILNAALCGPTLT